MSTGSDVCRRQDGEKFMQFTSLRGVVKTSLRIMVKQLRAAMPIMKLCKVSSLTKIGQVLPSLVDTLTLINKRFQNQGFTWQRMHHGLVSVEQVGIQATSPPKNGWRHVHCGHISLSHSTTRSEREDEPSLPPMHHGPDGDHPK
jgi:hypothetical protein